jgi:hypothetical protein
LKSTIRPGVARRFPVVAVMMVWFPSTLFPMSWTVELLAHWIRHFGLVPWFSHHQSRMESSSILFIAIWWHISCLTSLRFWGLNTFSGRLLIALRADRCRLSIF